MIAWLPAVLLSATTSRTFMGPDTYPPEALRRHQEGKVITRLHVGIDGRVASCAIKKSSGSPWLDEDACNKLLRRARFTPAHDDKGNAIESDTDVPINYALP